MPQEYVNLIKDFGFTYDEYRDWIVIKSKYDYWLINNSNLYSAYKNKTKIKLFHLNRMGKCGKHFQGSFRNLHHCLAYLTRHDHKYIMYI